MNWEEVKNIVNEWIWDSELGTYFWILSSNEETKTMRVKGLSRHETQLFFRPGRYFKNAKKINENIDN